MRKKEKWLKVDLCREEVVELTQKLIQIPSDNYKGSEAQCALFVNKW